MTAQPRLLVFPDADGVADFAARQVAELVAGRPEAILGLATGATMVPVYARLVLLARQAGTRFAGVTCFNLDEYAGLGPGDAGSFARVMREALFAPLGIPPGRTHLPDGCAPDLAAEAARYQGAIDAAPPIDLQLLGIGRNGHIGFNEPGTGFATGTRVVALSDATRAANRGAFPPGRETPGQAITMGIGTILRASRLLLLATGPAKADALAAAYAGPLDPACPASALRLHPRATFACDPAAAAGIDPAAWSRPR